MPYSDQHETPPRRSWKRLLASWRKAIAGSSHLGPPTYRGEDIWLTKLTEKTSEVTDGACFVARVRANSDGHPYIGEAIARGASLILAQRPPEQLGFAIPDEVAYVRVLDTAESLAWLAAAWEGFPSRHLITFGITGTDGKTSTANILYEILTAAELRVGLLSTTRAVIGQSQEPLALHVTTPEAPVVQRHLRRMVEAGLTHCILESTSHGLAQHRVTAVDFDIAIITNITHEHLDEHGDLEGYVTAKSRLFDMIVSPAAARFPESRKRAITKTAILNRDDSSYDMLRHFPYPLLLSYGIENSADVTASDIKFTGDETRFTLAMGGDVLGSKQLADVTTPLPGKFNLYNMLAASAAAAQLRIPIQTIRQGLETVRGIDGRMQRIDKGQDFLVVVDFAHTANALENAIKAARRMVVGKVICVFGSAGKRDVQKRRLMAAVSALNAELTILTAEDPRDESLDAILEAMAAGCRSAGGVEESTFWRIRDRGQAIYHALTLAGARDIVLICGKGHEQSICFGTTEYPWDDRSAAAVAIEAFLGDRPMPDLGLPTYS